MGKNLAEMTLEELWQLFPVFLTGHKAFWADWYKEEEVSLKRILRGEEVAYQPYRKHFDRRNMGEANY